MEQHFPTQCPACNCPLIVTQLYCESCETTVGGRFPLPILLHLDQDDRAFILSFVKASGSLKLMAEEMKLSYPTVRNLLDDLIAKIKRFEKK